MNVTSPRGRNLGRRQITVSSCGLIPEMRRFMRDLPQANLSVSLHASNDEIRRKLMPVGARYTVSELIDFASEYARETGRRFSFEYALFDGVNDDIIYAKELADRIAGRGFHVNLIPGNSVPGLGFEAPPEPVIREFAEALIARGVRTTTRRELGSDIRAACGQLRSERMGLELDLDRKDRVKRIMGNEALEVLKTRRSVRSYKPDPIPRDVLDKLLEAATYAPTGNGYQQPSIVLVQGDEMLGTMRRLNKMFLKITRDIDPYYGAPAIAIVFAPTDGSTYVEDACAVLTYIAVAARAVGVSSCWVHREREMFDTDEGKALKAEWGLSENYVGIGAIALGYPEGDVPEAAPRKADYIRFVE